MSEVKRIPDGYHTVTPMLSVKGARELLGFMERAFGAEEICCHDQPDGSVMHAQVRIGDSVVMVGEACEGMGETPGSLYLYVEDMDEVYRQALAAGAECVMEPGDMFWGDRFGSVKDKWGNTWSIATHIEDVEPGEIEQRAAAFMEQHGEGA